MLKRFNRSERIRHGCGFATLLLICGVLACRSNPYPDQISLEKETPSPSPAVTPVHSPLPAIGLDVPAVMAFGVGQESSYFINGWVNSAQLPILTIKGLPSGARFLQKESKISWMPDKDILVDPNRPGRVHLLFRTFPITVSLQDPDNLGVILSRNSVLIVTGDPEPTPTPSPIPTPTPTPEPTSTPNPDLGVL